MAASLQLTAYEVEQSVDIQQNTSRLYVRLEIVTSRGTYNLTGDTTGDLSINGQTFSLDGKHVNRNTTTVLYEATHTITHTADGSKSVTVAARFDPNTPATDPLSITQTVTLTPIPRASTLAATDANIGAVSTVVVNRRSDSYTHCVFWQFGELAGWLGPDGSVAQDPVWFTQTSVAFCLPESFYSQIPNAVSGVCQLMCITFLGDTQIGQPQYANFTVTTDPQLCAPEIALTVKDSNPATLALTGDENIFVRYASDALCTLSAQAKNGAAILQKTVEDVILEGESITFPGISVDRLGYSATDSRGYTVGGWKGLETVAYVPLTANLTAGRTDPTSGKATVTVRGNCYRGSFGKAENSLQILCRVGQQEQSLTPVFEGNTYEATGCFEGLDYLQAHSVTVTVADALATLTKTATIGKGIPVFDWGEEDFTFHVPVSVPAPQSDDHAVSKGYAVAKTGDAMTGHLSVPELSVRNDAGAAVQLCRGNGTVIGTVTTGDTYGSLLLSNNSPVAYEAYYTPPMTPGRTQGENYLLLTSKNPVTLAQGGTGATDAAAARANLGIGCQLLTAAGLDTDGVAQALPAGYKVYLVMGYPRSGSGIVTCVIPAIALTVDPVKYQLADDTGYCAFEMWLGDTPGVRKTGGNGAITAIFGLN